MKKIFIAAAALVITACGSQKEATSTIATSKTPTATTETAQDATTVATVEMTKPEAMAATIVNGNLEGFASLKDFKQKPFNAWFNPRYEEYTPDAMVITELTIQLKDVEVRAYMGTWCGDSKREVPQFYKILEETGYDQNNLKLVTVDRSKKKPIDLVEGYEIKRVPTFIFYRDGEELGRFVEYPRETLEKDILKIVSGADYKHSYEN